MSVSKRTFEVVHPNANPPELVGRPNCPKCGSKTHLAGMTTCEGMWWCNQCRQHFFIKGWEWHREIRLVREWVTRNQIYIATGEGE